MELYHVGQHCSEQRCNALDFLPYTCNRCKHQYCQEHWKVADHKCTHQDDPLYDLVIPSCPLCDSPVPLQRGQDPNEAVDRHITSNCAVKRSTSTKSVYAGRCSVPRCTQKSMVPITCNQCRHTFCLRHRFEADHSCTGTATAAKKSGRDAMLDAAEKRRQTNLYDEMLKQRLTDDEQMVRAIKASKAGESKSSSSERSCVLF